MSNSWEIRDKISLSWWGWGVVCTLIKKKIKFSYLHKEIKRDQLQSHRWLRPPHKFAHFLIYYEALPHIWLCTRSDLNFLICEENFVFFFISVWLIPTAHYSLLLFAPHSVRDPTGDFQVISQFSAKDKFFGNKSFAKIFAKMSQKCTVLVFKSSFAKLR